MPAGFSSGPYYLFCLEGGRKKKEENIFVWPGWMPGSPGFLFAIIFISLCWSMLPWYTHSNTKNCQTAAELSDFSERRGQENDILLITPDL